MAQAHRKNRLLSTATSAAEHPFGYEADGLRARVSDFGLAKAVSPLTFLSYRGGNL